MNVVFLYESQVYRPVGIDLERSASQSFPGVVLYLYMSYNLAPMAFVHDDGRKAMFRSFV